MHLMAISKQQAATTFIIIGSAEIGITTLSLTPVRHFCITEGAVN